MYYKTNGSGKAVVFLHGWGTDGSIFDGITQILGKYYTCVVPDLWGFGKSEMPDTDGWTVEDYADRLHMFFVERGITSASIVAHSFGGRIAVVFASKYPAYVDNLVLASSAGMRKFSFKRIIKAGKYRATKFLSKYVDITLPKGSADYESCPIELRNTFVKVVNDNLCRYAVKVSCPTLIVWGKADVETPLWMAEKYKKCIKGSCIVQLDGGHFAVFENTRLFCAIVRAFLL